MKAPHHRPTLALVASGIAWFVAGVVLLLIHSIQLHTPAFFAGHEWLTFGRVQAAAETALVFGWCANVGLATARWLSGTCGGESLTRWAAASWTGILFWNVGVLIGIGGILAGDLGAYSLLQIPGYVLPLLGLAWAGIAAPCIAGWLLRGEAPPSVAQGYAAAALLAPPCFYAAAQALFSTASATGVSQAIVAAWAGEGMKLLWLGAAALSLAYHFNEEKPSAVPATRRAAAAGLVCLVAFGPWAGTRVLAGGPVPEWIPAIGAGASWLLLAHFGCVGLSLKGTFASSVGNATMRFVLLGIGCYLALGACDAALAWSVVAERIRFTFLEEARLLLLLLGAFTPLALGGVYSLVPQLSGRAWATDGLIRGHHRAAALGLLLIVAGLVGAALTQAAWLPAGTGAGGTTSSVSFANLQADTRPWLLMFSYGVCLELLGALMLLVNALLLCLRAQAAAHDDTQPAQGEP